MIMVNIINDYCTDYAGETCLMEKQKELTCHLAKQETTTEDHHTINMPIFVTLHWF